MIAQKGFGRRRTASLIEPRRAMPHPVGRKFGMRKVEGRCEEGGFVVTGMSNDEAAVAIDVSPASGHRMMNYAKAWLKVDLA